MGRIAYMDPKPPSSCGYMFRPSFQAQNHVFKFDRPQSINLFAIALPTFLNHISSMFNITGTVSIADLISSAGKSEGLGAVQRLLVSCN